MLALGKVFEDNKFEHDALLGSSSTSFLTSSRTCTAPTCANSYTPDHINTHLLTPRSVCSY
jgi:hypothetical protein